MDKKLQAIKERSGMNIKSGRVMMEVKDRDWLLSTIENLRKENVLLDRLYHKALNK
jgi:hypothetical protein